MILISSMTKLLILKGTLTAPDEAFFGAQALGEG